jgi:hypothetical protein
LFRNPPFFHSGFSQSPSVSLVQNGLLGLFPEKTGCQGPPRVTTKNHHQESPNSSHTCNLSQNISHTRNSHAIPDIVHRQLSFYPNAQNLSLLGQLRNKTTRQKPTPLVQETANGGAAPAKPKPALHLLHQSQIKS